MARQLQQKTRRRILEAARHLFGTQGYPHTSIAHIAAELHMGHGTFYRYFANKRDILEHVVAEALGKITSVTFGKDPTSPRDIAEHAQQVDAIGREIFAAFMHDSAGVRLVFYEGPGIDDATRDRIADAFRHFSDFTAAYLQNGVDRGYLRPDMHVPTVAAALSAIVFDGVRQLADASDPAAEADKWIATYQMLASGLAARPSLE